MFGCVLFGLCAATCIHGSRGPASKLPSWSDSAGPVFILTITCTLSAVQCDIAMLTVDDDEFWEDVQPLEINGLPAMQESVMVVGFPTG